MQVQIFLEFKILSDAQVPTKKLTHAKQKYALQTYFDQYGLVTNVISQYAVQPHDCRVRPYWKGRNIVRPWFLGYVWLAESVSVYSSKTNAPFYYQSRLLCLMELFASLVLFFYVDHPLEGKLANLCWNVTANINHKGGKRGHIVTDTLLLMMFLGCANWETFVSATMCLQQMCPRLPGPLQILQMWLVNELLYFALINLQSCNLTV